MSNPINTLGLRDGGWTPHIPGDPMPVSKDTLVEVRFIDGCLGGMAVGCAWYWGDCGPRSSIAAYREVIPEMASPRFKAGDKVRAELILNEATAAQLNTGDRLDVSGYEIVYHEPNPEPLTAHINVCMDTMGWTYPRSQGSWSNGLPTLKLTYNPATKQASVEVVA
jgi:hypothetical protein